MAGKLGAERSDKKPKQAIRLEALSLIQSGKSPAEVASLLGVHRVSVYRWSSIFEKTGAEGLVGKKPPGKPPRLLPSQYASISQAIGNGHPRSFGLFGTLWTVELVGEFLSKEFGLNLSRRTVGRILNKLGIGAKRPSNGILCEVDLKIRSCVQTEFSKFRQLAERDQAEIFFVQAVLKPGTLPSCQENFILTAISMRGCLFFRHASGIGNENFFKEFSFDLRATVKRPILIVHLRGQSKINPPEVPEYFEKEGIRIISIEEGD